MSVGWVFVTKRGRPGVNLSLNLTCSNPPSHAQTFGLPPPIVVAQQANPDPEFSSLGSNPPNPEEGKGVWTLAYETGG